jgi:two-component system chemotaxis sensor kinase CheA
MDLEAARKALVLESRELLADMESALLEMERSGPAAEGINSVFRAAHTIKGSVGLIGLDHIVRFTHVVETELDDVRAGRAQMDPDLISLLLECKDHLDLLVDGIEKDAAEEELDPDTRARLVARLESRRPNQRALTPATPVEAHAEVVEPDRGLNDSWHISLRLASDVLRCGMDPLSFLRYLGRMGEILHVEILDDTLPTASEMDPETFYLGLEIQFRSGASRAEIEAVFEFVSEGSRIQILPPQAKVEEYISLVRSLPEPALRLGEILVACGALTPGELDASLRKQAPEPVHQPLGSILVQEKVVAPVVVEAALQKQKSIREKSGDSRTLRVEATKLDALIDLVGELVIASATARLATEKDGAKESGEAVANLANLVENIRDAALGLRMVPVGEVFDRFPRMVRDLAKELGKRIELSITGAETELDKSMVERIADPLTHIVRNSIDHGIEPEAVRVAAGKSPEGALRFHAFHETGSIVVEVSDDGGGIKRDKVRAKAIERGLITPEQVLSDREVLQLVFEPGFSTAEKVTNLSGRGVGMDVVKRNVEALRGEIEIESEEGEGTTLRLRFPLTLAIIDGFQFQVGKGAFIVPLEMVKECADLVPSDVTGGIVRLRDEPLPFLRLREMFSIGGTAPRRESLVVVQHGPRRMGLVVDQLAGELQVVIKPLGALFRNLKGVGGTTILGNGSVALILDVPNLVHSTVDPHRVGTALAA